MREFDTGDKAFSRSIALDASTVGQVTVTVAVPATRKQEWRILETIYSNAGKAEFRPFLDKANDLRYDQNTEFFEAITREAPRRVLATAHLGQDGSDPARIEAVQSAILISELIEPESLVLVDGNAEKATKFAKAISGISSAIPPTTHCLRAEQYYPTALLADICASHLAHTITHPRDCLSVTPIAPQSKREYDSKWGKAYSALYNAQADYERTQIVQKRGRSVKERICCWYDGRVSVGDGEYPSIDSLNRIVNFAEQNGFQQVADQLSEI